MSDCCAGVLKGLLACAARAAPECRSDKCVAIALACKSDTVCDCSAELPDCCARVPAV